MSDTEFLIRGPKEIKQGKVYLGNEPDDPIKDSKSPNFPFDNDADYVYYSKRGGFVTPELAMDSILTNPIHYGAGGFEGVRVYYSKYGTIFPELENNIIRLMYSTLAFDYIVQNAVLEELGNEDVYEVEVKRIRPQELYEIAQKCHLNGEDPHLPHLRKFKKGGILTESEIQLRMRAMCGDEVKDFTMKEIDTIMKVLAYVNKLVSEDYFPEGLEMVNSGYFRPSFWVSGEGGLKVPTGGKPMYFAVTTLPWGTYLKEEDYEKGLDVVYAPYPRIDRDMPTDKKIAGNYVNSALNINLGVRLGYGEILAFKNGRIVEGSAENLFVIQEKGGQYRILTPPVGDGPLPGTTRDRVLRVFESMDNVEVMYKSPTKEEIEKACGVFFTGTGAQIIHMRSVTEDSSLTDLAKASRLASENEHGNDKNITIRSNKRTVMINDGKKHPVINEIQGRYEKMVLTPKLVRPVYDVDYETLGKLLKLDDIKDFTDGEERALYRGGELKKYTDYISDVQRKTRMTANVIKKAFQKAGRLMRQTA